MKPSHNFKGRLMSLLTTSINAAMTTWNAAAYLFLNDCAISKKYWHPKGLLVANFINDVGFEAPLEEGEAAFASHFQQVACIHATYGLNQVYVGGAQLQGPKHLESMSEKWAESHDRRLWQSIRFRV